MPLPSAWVDKIFEKLAVRYGARFLGMYSGVDLNAVKADWADELTWFVGDKARGIAYALDNLPPADPPNASQFRNLCHSMPAPAMVTLPAPKQDPARVAEALKSLRQPVADTHPKAWAWRLKGREEAGDKLRPFQRRAWREALQNELRVA